VQDKISSNGGFVNYGNVNLAPGEGLVDGGGFDDSMAAQGFMGFDRDDNPYDAPAGSENELSLGGPPGAGILEDEWMVEYPEDEMQYFVQDPHPGNPHGEDRTDRRPGDSRDPADFSGGGRKPRGPSNFTGGNAITSQDPFDTSGAGGFDAIGWDGSTNQDFYAQQFADARGQGARNQFGEYLGRERTRQNNVAERERIAGIDRNDPFAMTGGKDPFAWAEGGSEGMEAQIAGAASERGLNDRLVEGMTASQMLATYGKGMSEKELAYLTKQATQPGSNWSEQTNWSTKLRNGMSPDELLSRIGGQGQTDQPNEWQRAAYGKLFNLAGAKQDPSGPSAAEGYALPVRQQAQADAAAAAATGA
jgi:hypothetical protein